MLRIERYKSTINPRPSILVVEDEVLVFLITADYLRECGYRVYEAVNAREAVAMLQAPEATVDIVFSDMQMPEGVDRHGLAHGFETTTWVSW